MGAPSFYLFLLSMSFTSNTKTECVHEVVVDTTQSTGELRRIWDNTGLSPPASGVDTVKYLTSKEQKINIALIGSLPFKAISHIRIHWLLDLITVNSTDNGEKFEFNFQLLDELMFWLKKHRLRPGFELMGNPGGLFTDLDSNPDKVILWQNLIMNLGHHYCELFGVEEVKKWRFELWNEPDSMQYNILNLTTLGYLRYALASVKGLRANGLKVSGPAGTFRDVKHHNLSWSLLELCDSMISLTGRCELDSITFHKKGEGSPQKVVTSTSEFYSLATNLYPHLKVMHFANNEADILSGWWREEEWRGDVNYAAAMCEVLTSFLSDEFQQQNVLLAYISNDNGFINQPPAYFNQRTLLTRFQMNNTKDKASQFVRKPVMLATALLSYLGPEQLQVYLKHLQFSSTCNKLSVLAGGAEDIVPGWNAAVILATSALTTNCSDASTVNVQLKLPPLADLAYVVYRLDNVLTNPKKVWESNGRLVFPDADVLKQMRENEGPYVEPIGQIKGAWKKLSLQLRSPSVTLIHLCAKPRVLPAKIDEFHAVNITYNEVLLLWQDSYNRCVKTYEIYFCTPDCLDDKDYTLITNGTLIMLAYQYRSTRRSYGRDGTSGTYKIRVRDYWDQRSFGQVPCKTCCVLHGITTEPSF